MILPHYPDTRYTGIRFGGAAPDSILRGACAQFSRCQIGPWSSFTNPPASLIIGDLLITDMQWLSHARPSLRASPASERPRSLLQIALQEEVQRTDQPNEHLILHSLSPQFLRIGTSPSAATFERRMPCDRPLTQASAHLLITKSNVREVLAMFITMAQMLSLAPAGWPG